MWAGRLIGPIGDLIGSSRVEGEGIEEQGEFDGR